MKTTKHAFAGLLLTFALAACAPPSPSAHAEQAKKDQSDAAFLASELRPLIPLCLRTLETGTLVSAARMASLGFKPAFGISAAQGYRKRQRPTENGQTRQVNTTFTPSTQKCEFGVISVGRAKGSGGVIRQQLEAQAYQISGGTRNETKFTKGAVTVEVSSAVKSSFILIRIEKAS